MNTELMFSSAKCEWETPQDLFDKHDDHAGAAGLGVCVSDLPYTSVLWDSDEGTRQDRAYEAGRDSEMIRRAGVPKGECMECWGKAVYCEQCRARRELAEALREVDGWRAKGLWPPQEAQERLYRARMEAERLGIGEIV